MMKISDISCHMRRKCSMYSEPSLKSTRLARAREEKGPKL